MGLGDLFSKDKKYAELERKLAEANAAKDKLSLEKAESDKKLQAETTKRQELEKKFAHLEQSVKGDTRECIDICYHLKNTKNLKEFIQAIIPGINKLGINVENLQGENIRKLIKFIKETNLTSINDNIINDLSILYSILDYNKDMANQININRILYKKFNIKNYKDLMNYSNKQQKIDEFFNSEALESIIVKLKSYQHNEAFDNNQFTIPYTLQLIKVAELMKNYFLYYKDPVGHSFKTKGNIEHLGKDLSNIPKEYRKIYKWGDPVGNMVEVVAKYLVSNNIDSFNLLVEGYDLNNILEKK